ncbi:hypothetical protein QTP70_001293 [Hemibagrus guttatus]|uniref:Uncharacterized protein n=1 Tax=Hemibagrus guttatus TaxID=175788 RepID=A0AAE0Q5M5_9TELE|nr:hypothetical protein QTP70_001293 [Hemibagrus guttatus]
MLDPSLVIVSTPTNQLCVPVADLAAEHLEVFLEGGSVTSPPASGHLREPSSFSATTEGTLQGKMAPQQAVRERSAVLDKENTMFAFVLLKNVRHAECLENQPQGLF